MIQYAYNSVHASSRLDDGLNLVHSQRWIVAFDYKFCTQEGQLIFLLELANKCKCIYYAKFH